MSYENRIQIGREVAVFAKKETTVGTLIYPTSTDFIVPAGQCELNQAASYTDSEEVRNSRSLIARFRDKNPAGSWSIPMYCRPDGVAGTQPDGHALLRAAFGGEEISAGSSVTYSLTMENALDTLSLCFGFDAKIY